MVKLENMWAILSVSAALCWATSNIIDKTVLTKWVKNPSLPIIISGTAWLVFGVAIYFIKGLSHLSPLNAFLAILTGAFSIVGWLFYLKAMQIQEASRIVPLSNLSKVFVLILAAVFLGEILTPIKYFGVFLLIAGAILISINRSFKISFEKAFWWIVLTAVFYSVNTILIKYLLNFADYWTVFGYKCAGIFISALPVTFLYFGELAKTVKRHGKRVFIAMAASESITALGILLSFIAMSIGYVSLVNSLYATQPLFVLLFTVLLSIFFPSILKEEISKSTIFLKVLAITSIVLGVILVTS